MQRTNHLWFTLQSVHAEEAYWQRISKGCCSRGRKRVSRICLPFLGRLHNTYNHGQIFSVLYSVHKIHLGELPSAGSSTDSDEPVASAPRPVVRPHSGIGLLVGPAGLLNPSNTISAGAVSLLSTEKFSARRQAFSPAEFNKPKALQGYADET